MPERTTNDGERKDQPTVSLSVCRADGLAEVLRLADMHITLAWHSDPESSWSIRIESDLDAEHDSYYTAHGQTFTEALAAAVKWTEALDV